MCEDKKYLRYWGRARQRQDGRWECHLLPYHCFDVAAVGQYLADRLGITNYIAQKLRCEKLEAIPIITFLCAVHDIGWYNSI